MKKITIITATFNSKRTIRECIKSVISQDYPFIEYIIVDGGSTDGTLDIIREYTSKINILIIEKDEGIYDALNKGIKVATGDVIAFLNSDDFYKNKKIISIVANHFNDSNTECVYGDLAYFSSKKYGKIVRYWKAGNFSVKKIFRGWIPPHPTFFALRSIYEKFGSFRLELETSADYELMLRFLLIHNIKVSYIPEILVYMRSGGVSNISLINRLKANRMDRKAWIVNNLKPYPWIILFKPIRKIPQYWRKTAELMEATTEVNK